MSSKPTSSITETPEIKEHSQQLQSFQTDLKKAANKHYDNKLMMSRIDEDPAMSVESNASYPANMSVWQDSEPVESISTTEAPLICEDDSIGKHEGTTPTKPPVSSLEEARQRIRKSLDSINQSSVSRTSLEQDLAENDPVTLAFLQELGDGLDPDRKDYSNNERKLIKQDPFAFSILKYNSLAIDQDEFGSPIVTYKGNAVELTSQQKNLYSSGNISAFAGTLLTKFPPDENIGLLAAATSEVRIEHTRERVDDLMGRGRDQDALRILKDNVDGAFSVKEQEAVWQEAGENHFTPEYFKNKIQGYRSNSFDDNEGMLKTGQWLRETAKNTPKEAANIALEVIMEDFDKDWIAGTTNKRGSILGASDGAVLYSGISNLVEASPDRAENVATWLTSSHSNGNYLFEKLKNNDFDAIVYTAKEEGGVLLASKVQDNLKQVAISSPGSTNFFGFKSNSAAEDTAEDFDEQFLEARSIAARNYYIKVAEHQFNEFNTDATREIQPYFDNLSGERGIEEDIVSANDAELRNIIGRSMGLVPTDLRAAKSGQYSRDWYVEGSEERKQIDLIAGWVRMEGGTDNTSYTVKAKPFVYASSLAGVSKGSLFEITKKDGEKVVIDGSIADDVIAQNKGNAVAPDADLHVNWKYNSIEEFFDDNELDPNGDIYMLNDVRGIDGAHTKFNKIAAANVTTGEVVLPWVDVAGGVVGIAGGLLLAIPSGGSSLLLSAGGWAMIGGTMAYGAYRSGDELLTMSGHGQDIWTLSDARSRGAWFDLATLPLTALGVGAGIKAAAMTGKGAHALNMVSKGAGVLDTGLGIEQLGEGGYMLSTEWENMSGEQRAQSVLNMGVGAAGMGSGIFLMRGKRAADTDTVDITLTEGGDKGNHLPGQLLLRRGQKAEDSATTLLGPDQRTDTRQEMQNIGTQTYHIGDADAQGSYHQGVVTLLQNAIDPQHTLSHETIHALKDTSLFKAEEWGALETAAIENGWIDKHNIREKYEARYAQEHPGKDLETLLIEEAIAEEFAQWRNGSSIVPEQIRLFFQKIMDLLSTIRRNLSRESIYTTDDVFRKVEIGEIASRPLSEEQSFTLGSRDGLTQLPDNVASLARRVLPERIGIEVAERIQGGEGVMLGLDADKFTRAKKLYNSGITIPRIADLLDIEYSDLYSMLIKEGVHTPDLQRNSDVQYRELQGFKSKAIEVVEKSGWRSATPDQWMKVLSGEKKDLLEWMSVETWLQNKGDSISRKDLLEYLTNNQIKMEEVYRYSDPEKVIQDPTAREAKFIGDTIAGGTDYTELLIRADFLKKQGFSSENFRDHDIVYVRYKTRISPSGEKVLFIEEVQSDLQRQGRALGYRTLDDTDRYLQLAERKPDAFQIQREIYTGIDTNFSDLKSSVSSAMYTILGRYPTTREVNAIATVFCDSEWGLGSFLGTRLDLEQFYAKRDEIGDTNYRQIVELIKESFEYDDFNEVIKSSIVKQKEADVTQNDLELLNEYEDLAPQAPFKGKLIWQLALKRMLAKAAEDGYDAISWARRDQIAEAQRMIDPTAVPEFYDKDFPGFLKRYTRQWGGEVEQVHLIDNQPNYIVRLTPEMRNIGTQTYHLGDADAQGSYQRGVVTLLENAIDPQHTLSHETIHALKDTSLFKAEEWDALETAAIENGWIDKHDIREKYEARYAQEHPGKDLETLLIEEAIAEEFANWRKGSSIVPEQIRLFFQKIVDLLSTIRRNLSREGIYTADDIFRKVEIGEIASRPLSEEQNFIPGSRDGLTQLPDNVASLARRVLPERIGIEVAERIEGGEGVMLAFELDEGQLEIAKAMLADRRPISEIAKELKLNYNTLLYYLKKIGLHEPRKIERVLQSRLELAKVMLSDERSIGEIAEVTGISYDQLLYYFQALELVQPGKPTVVMTDAMRDKAKQMAALSIPPGNIARDLGVDYGIIREYLLKEGLYQPQSKGESINSELLQIAGELYDAGMSIHNIADELLIDRGLLKKRLINAEIHIPRSKQEISPEVFARAEIMYKNAKPASEIAIELGIEYPRLKHHLIDQGLFSPGEKVGQMTLVKQERALKMLREGDSIEEVASVLHVHIDTLQARLREVGILDAETDQFIDPMPSAKGGSKNATETSIPVEIQETAKRMFLEEDQSILEVADELGINPASLYRWFVNEQIYKPITRRGRQRIDDDAMAIAIEQYQNAQEIINLTGSKSSPNIRAIARGLGVGDTNLAQRLISAGIHKTVEDGARVIDRATFEKAKVLYEEAVENLQPGERINIEAIAEQLSVSSEALRSKLKRAGILELGQDRAAALEKNIITQAKALYQEAERSLQLGEQVNMAEIARKLGVSQSMLVYRLTREGIHTQQNRVVAIDSDMLAKAKELYAELEGQLEPGVQVSLTEMARELGVNSSSLRSWLVKEGVHTPREQSGRNHIDDATLEIAKALYREAESQLEAGEQVNITKIAQAVGVNRSSLRDRLVSEGVHKTRDGKTVDEAMLAKAQAMYEEAKSQLEPGKRVNIAAIAKALNLKHETLRIALVDAGIHVPKEKTSPKPARKKRQVFELNDDQLEIAKSMLADRKPVSEIAKVLKVKYSPLLRYLSRIGIYDSPERQLLDPGRRELAKAMYADGMTLYAIAKELRENTSRVSYYLQAVGLHQVGQAHEISITPKIFDEAVERFNSGDSIGEIAQDLGINPKTLEVRLRLEGVIKQNTTLDSDTLSAATGLYQSTTDSIRQISEVIDADPDALYTDLMREGTHIPRRIEEVPQETLIQAKQYLDEGVSIAEVAVFLDIEQPKLTKNLINAGLYQPSQSSTSISIANMEEAKQQLDKGVPLENAAAQFGIDPDNLENQLRKNGYLDPAKPTQIDRGTFQTASEMYAEGKRIHEIADELGIDAVSLYKRLKESNQFESKAKAVITGKELLKIKARFDAGDSVDDIAPDYNITPKKLEAMLRRAGYNIEYRFNRVISEDIIQQAADMLQEGKKLTVVADELGVNLTALYRPLKRLGVISPKPRHKPIPPKTLEQARQLRSEGISLAEIGRRFNVDPAKLGYELTKKLKGRKTAIDDETLDKLIPRFLDGESINQLSKEIGVSRKTLTDRLRERGIDTSVGRYSGKRHIEKGTAQGSYTDRLIEVSSSALDPMRTVRHETIHALKDMGVLSSKEWNALEKTAEAEGWIEKHNIREKYEARYREQFGEDGAEIAMLEEAIAEQYAQWQSEGAPVSKDVEGFFQLILAWLARLKNNLFNEGIHSVEDVFHRVESGEVKARSVTDTTSQSAIREDLSDFSDDVTAYIERVLPDDVDIALVDKVSTGSDARLALPGMESAALRAVNDSPWKQAAPDQWLRLLQKQEKRDLLAWTGVEAWLEGLGSDPVTKETMLEYLTLHQINLEEQFLTQRPFRIPRQKRVELTSQEKNDGVIDAYEIEYDEGGVSRVLTMSDGSHEIYYPNGDFEYAGGLRDAIESIRSYVYPEDDTNVAVQYGFKVSPSGIGYKELLLRLPELKEAGYTSPHFADHEVVSIRFDERPDPSGKRVLFINEIQSDIHQRGRKSGYRSRGDDAHWEAIGGRDSLSYQIREDILVHILKKDDQRLKIGHKIVEQLGDKALDLSDLEHLTLFQMIMDIGLDPHFYDSDLNLTTGREANSLVKKIGQTELGRVIHELQQDVDVQEFRQGINHILSQYQDQNPDMSEINFVHRYDASFEINEDTDLPRLYPDAPFKGDLWIHLALKRMLKYAADNGFDAISWARSDQIAKSFWTDPAPLRQTYDSKIAKFLGPYVRRLGNAEIETALVVKEDPKPNQIIYLTPEMRNIGTQTYHLGDADAQGSYQRGVVTLLENAIDPQHTLSHETIHALKDTSLFKAEEWDALETAAIENGWIDKHDIREKYEARYAQEHSGKDIETLLIEEAIAEEFAQWRKGSSIVPEQIRIFFQKLMDLLSTIRRNLSREGIYTADDIFRKVEIGEIASRPLSEEQNFTPGSRDGLTQLPDNVASLARRVLPERIGIEVAERIEGGEGVMLAFQPTQKQLAVIEEMSQAGQSVTAIKNTLEARFGGHIGHSQLNRFLLKAGFRSPDSRKVITDETFANAKLEYIAGRPIAEIARKYKVGSSALYQAFVNAGVHNPDKIAQSRNQQKRTPTQLDDAIVAEAFKRYEAEQKRLETEGSDKKPNVSDIARDLGVGRASLYKKLVDGGLITPRGNSVEIRNYIIEAYKGALEREQAIGAAGSISLAQIAKNAESDGLSVTPPTVQRILEAEGLYQKGQQKVTRTRLIEEYRKAREQLDQVGRKEEEVNVAQLVRKISSEGHSITLSGAHKILKREKIIPPGQREVIQNKVIEAFNEAQAELKRDGSTTSVNVAKLVRDLTEAGFTISKTNAYRILNRAGLITIKEIVKENQSQSEFYSQPENNLQVQPETVSSTTKDDTVVDLTLPQKNSEIDDIPLAKLQRIKKRLDNGEDLPSLSNYYGYEVRYLRAQLKLWDML